MQRHLTSCKLMWNGSVYNIKNTLIIQFLNEIYRLLTKSFRFLPSRIRKSSCSYRPAESQRANACHSDRKTQLSGEQNNRLSDSMYEKLLLLIPRFSLEYKGQKRAYQQCRMKMFTVPLSPCAKAMKSHADSLKDWAWERLTRTRARGTGKNGGLPATVSRQTRNV